MNGIHCFKGRLPNACTLSSGCLESELLCFNVRVEGNYLSYLSFHCIITQPDCSHVLVHSGSGLVVILPLIQAKEYESRNLIVSAHGKTKQWSKTTNTLHKLFFICNQGLMKSKHSSFIML